MRYELETIFPNDEGIYDIPHDAHILGMKELELPTKTTDDITNWQIVSVVEILKVVS